MPPTHRAPLIFSALFSRQVVCQNFDRRGWTRTEGDDYNVFWATVQTVKYLFEPSNGIRLADSQLICHFPNHYELTRKDLMVKNIKRYYKEQAKLGIMVEDFLPVTYLLPADYSLFVEEFRREGEIAQAAALQEAALQEQEDGNGGGGGTAGGGSGGAAAAATEEKDTLDGNDDKGASKDGNVMWIMKPSNRAQGKGIFIINKLQQITKWSKGRWGKDAQETYVVSRYIDNPLLIGGRKFDLRIYVLVTSFRPLRMYLGDGFARFCTVKYDTDISEIDNPFIHLTNVSLQKHSADYNNEHGGKWNVTNLRLFLESTRGLKATEVLFQKIDDLLVHSARAVQNVMINDRHCFECYGYDLLLDGDLRPWLIEVNASPSLTTTTAQDKEMKTTLIRDVLDIVVPEEINGLLAEGGFKGANSLGPCFDKGDFVVLYDEAAEKEREERGEEKGRRGSAMGRLANRGREWK